MKLQDACQKYNVGLAMIFSNGQYQPQEMSAGNPVGVDLNAQNNGLRPLIKRCAVGME